MRTLQRKFGQLKPAVKFEVMDATKLGYDRCGPQGLPFARYRLHPLQIDPARAVGAAVCRWVCTRAKE